MVPFLPDLDIRMPSMAEIEADLEISSDGWRSLLPRAESSVESEKRCSHAIVIGGSIAGLLAARVLSDHFVHVTIVDRDRIPTGPEFRHGVPQSRHLHALLKRGLMILEELFPGVEGELLDAGAVRLTGADFLRLSPAGWAERFDGPPVISATRELIEWSVRNRITRLRNVTVLSEHEVVGLVTTSDSIGVCGIQMRERGSHSPTLPVKTLQADLVIDASGRNSKAGEWLEALGYPKPKETTIDSFLGYASCVFAAEASVAAEWKVLMIGDKPPTMPRAGALFPIEGNRWMVTLAGYGRDYPPTDIAGFMEFARRLRSDVLYYAIRNAKPISQIHGFRSTLNRRRHFEGLSRRPEGFVVVGDAACAFNPVYGQGMTVAAMTAAVLRDNLAARGQTAGAVDMAGFASQFQQQVARVSHGAWVIATGADVRYPTTEGHRPNPTERIVQRYLDRVIAAANHDEMVSAAFLRVVHLIDQPFALFRPAIALRALFGARRDSNPPTRQRPTKADSLAAIPLLKACSKDELAFLATQTDEMHFRRGEVLKSAGQPCNELIVVVEGTLIDREGRQMGAGSVIGADEMWQRLPEPTSIVAVTPGRMLVMGHGQFRAWKAAATTASRRAMRPSARDTEYRRSSRRARRESPSGV